MPFQVIQFVDEEYKSNVFLVVDLPSKHSIIIDSGVRAPLELFVYLSTSHVCLDYLFLTHEHFDHIGGVSSIKTRFNVDLVASKECSKRLGDPRNNLSIYALLDGRGIFCQKADIEFSEEQHTFQWLNRELRIMIMPGHSVGGAMYLIDQFLFTGDILIPGRKTITKLPGGDKELARNSLETVRNNFDGTTIICPGHGRQVLLKDVDFAKCYP